MIETATFGTLDLSGAQQMSIDLQTSLSLQIAIYNYCKHFQLYGIVTFCQNISISLKKYIQRLEGSV